MSLLADLPDDILGLISCLLNGFDNCSLWMASDSKLKQRLVNNVITEFNINYTIPGRYLWPGNFLKKLKRLSRLSLVVDEAVNQLVSMKNVELFPIETLNFLTLEWEHSDQSLQRVPFDKQNKYIHLNDFYPNLEYFSTTNISDLQDTDFTTDFLRCLPHKLKSLEILGTGLVENQTVAIQNLNSNIALLPRTLTYLNLPLTATNYEPILDCSLLPPNLTHLVTSATIQKESAIPPNITVLDLGFTEYDIHQLAPYLPIGLKRLTLSSDSVPGESLVHLQHLESLKLYCNSNDDPVSFVSPPKLKKFAGRFDVSEEINTLSFPDGLVQLTFCLENGLDREFFATLPQSITKLATSCEGCREPFEFFDLLPNNLKSFKSNLPIIENLSSLPQNLIKLHLIVDGSNEISDTDQFPPMLETLILSHIKVPHSLLKLLPSNLKSLDLSSVCTFIDDEIIPFLPRGLTSLKLRTQLNITDISAGLYPPNLKKLMLLEKNEITDEGIAYLPRGLTNLRLYQNTRLTDNCIKHLPPTLSDFLVPESKQITLLGNKIYTMISALIN